MRRAGNALLFIIGLISSLITILLAYIQWADKATDEGKIAILFLSVFLVILLAAYVYQSYQYSRKARYVESLPYLNRLFLEVQALAAKQSPSLQDIKNTGTLVTTRLAEAFSLISGTKCSACIKVIQSDSSERGKFDPRPKTVTLCRDSLSESARNKDKKSVTDWIDQNTDFEQLLKYAGTPQGRCFFANYLPNVREYKNSSIEAYGSPSSVNFPILADFLRDLYWKLPYKSTIVVPITSQSDLSNQERKLIGYLCIDSRSRYVFSRHYDIDLMVGVADCLSVVMDRYWDEAWENAQGREK